MIYVHKDGKLRIKKVNAKKIDTVMVQFSHIILYLNYLISKY